MNHQTVKLLLELTALLDVRLSILGSMDPKRTAMIMQDTSYTGRIIDDFPGFDKDTFKKAAASGDKKYLFGAMRTGVITIVHDFVTRIMNRNIASPTPLNAEIVVNIYPYVLTEKEQAFITLGLIKSLPLCPKITITSLPVEKLTPYYLRGFAAVVMYSFNEWLTHFLAEDHLSACPIPDTTLFVPAILGRLDEGDTPPEDLGKAFNEISSEFHRVMSIVFTPVEMFCSIAAKRHTPDAPEGAESTVSEEDDQETEAWKSTGEQPVA